MKKTFFAAKVCRKIDGSLYVDKNDSQNRSLIEAIVIISLLALFTALIAFTNFNSRTTAATYDLFNTNQQAVGGADASNSEFEFFNFAGNVKKAGIYRNGKDRTDGIELSIFPCEGRHSSKFGGRSNPFGTGGSEYHSGLDISAPTGTPVVAAADGIVTFSGWKGGYGNIVIIEHDGEQVSTRYAHLSRRDVVAGDIIKGGTQIGLVGSTGRSTGPHLHYEVRIDGKATNPLSYYSLTQNR